MKKLGQWIAGLAACLMMVACSGSPGSVITSFYQALDSGDIEKASKMIDTSGNDQGAIAAKMIVSKIAEKIKSQGGLDSVVIESEKVTDDTAVVTVKVKTKTGPSTNSDTMRLVKKDGKWLISLK